MLAVKLGQLPILKTLASYESTTINKVTSQKSAIHLAIGGVLKEKTLFLIESGADVM